MLEFQKEVIELVNIPNFLEEHKKFNVYCLPPSSSGAKVVRMLSVLLCCAGR
jgi:hypothetical protein